MIRSRAFPLGNGGQQQQADFVPFQGQPRFLGERSHVFGGAAGRVSEGETGSRSLDLDTPSKIQSTVFRSSACPSACASQGSSDYGTAADMAALMNATATDVVVVEDCGGL